MAFWADYESFSSPFAHKENPLRIALQIFEFLYLVYFQISAILMAQFTGMPLHPLF